MTSVFSWRAEIGRAVLVALFPVVVLLLYQRFDPDFELVDDDAVASWQPVFTDFARQLRSGHMPVWSHHTQCGFPLVGWPQPTFVNPIHWFSHLICSLLGWDAREVFMSTLLHYFLAAAGTFVYLRRFGVVLPAAITACYAYTFSGVLLGLGSAWPTYVFMAAYWPAVLLSIEHLRVGKGARFLVPFLGLLGGLGFLGIDLMSMVKYTCFAGLYFLLRANPPTFRTNLKQIVGAGALALLIGLGQLLPSAEIILTSFRMDQGGIDVFTTPPTLWLGLIFPFWMLPWEYGTLRAAGGFFAGPCVLLGVMFTARFFLSLRGPHRALLIMAGVYLGLALGHHWYPSVILHALPGFSSFRWPFRWMLEASAALALLSGFGLHLAYEQLGRARGLIYAFIALTLFVLLMRYPPPPGMAARTAAMTIVWSLGLAGLYWAARANKRLAFLRIAGLWTVAAMVANIPVTQLTLLARTSQLLKDPLPVGQNTQERVLFLARHSEVVGAPSQGTLALSLPHQFQTRTVFGYVYRPTGQSWMEGVEVNGLLYDAGEKDVVRRFLAPASTLLATLRVGHVVVPQQNKLLVEACAAHPDLRLERETALYRIYRHQGFKEPAFFVRSLKSEESREEVVELGSRLKLPREALLEPSYAGTKEFAGTGTIEGFHEDHGNINLRVTGADEGFLVVTTSYFPRWRATVDGVQAPLYRANGSFLALRVPPGRHDVELIYWPVDHLLLLAVSGLSLLVVTGYCAWTLLRVPGLGCASVSRRQMNYKNDVSVTPSTPPRVGNTPCGGRR